MYLTQNVKQRLVVLPDISNEPDDEQSLVRLLMYSTDVDIEGLVATTSVHLKGAVRPDLIRRQIEAYANIIPNLRVHHSDYPDANALSAVVGEGPVLHEPDGLRVGGAHRHRHSAGAGRQVGQIVRAGAHLVVRVALVDVVRAVDLALLLDPGLADRLE